MDYKKKEYWMGMMVGFTISTIVWCFLWVSAIDKINETYKQGMEDLVNKNLSLNINNAGVC